MLEELVAFEAADTALINVSTLVVSKVLLQTEVSWGELYK